MRQQLRAFKIKRYLPCEEFGTWHHLLARAVRLRGFYQVQLAASFVSPNPTWVEDGNKHWKQ
jgi:hypothetical protein